MFEFFEKPKNLVFEFLKNQSTIKHRDRQAVICEPSKPAFVLLKTLLALFGGGYSRLVLVALDCPTLSFVFEKSAKLIVILEVIKVGCGSFGVSKRIFE